MGKYLFGPLRTGANYYSEIQALRPTHGLPTTEGGEQFAERVSRFSRLAVKLR